MFGRFLRNQRARNAGALAVNNAGFCAQRLALGMLTEMDAKNGSSLSAQSELGAQLIAICFFDYYLQNRVKPQLGDLRDLDISEDLEQFLRGSLGRMQAHPLFGSSGTKRSDGLSIWLQNQQSWCGTDIGGAPSDALPYTLARCFSTMAGFWQTSHCPLTGNPP